MDRLTRFEIEKMRSYDPNTEGPLTRTGLRIWQAICDRALSQEAVRDEALEEAARVCYPIIRREQGWEEDNHVALLVEAQNAIRALKREPNAAAPERVRADVSSQGNAPAPAAPDVTELIAQLRDMSFTLEKEGSGSWAMNCGYAATLLAKLGQDWVTEPVAWRREWDGDISDVGHMIYVDDPHDRDEPLSRWQPLYAKEPGASDD